MHTSVNTDLGAVELLTLSVLRMCTPTIGLSTPNLATVDSSISKTRAEIENITLHKEEIWLPTKCRKQEGKNGANDY